MSPIKYQLLATDMDGTVVGTDNQISPRNAAAIHRALAEGYEVLFATGRCPAEVRPFLKQYPDMHYVLCTNGSLIVDLWTGEPLLSLVIDPQVVEQALDAVKDMDYTPGFYLGDEFYMDQAVRGKLDYYNCDCFHRLFEDCATWVEDPYEMFRQNPDCVRKVNLYFHDPEEHREAGKRFSALPMNYPSGIPYNYEICPPGISKGTGLQQLANLLGLSIRQCIACGDGGNDEAMVRAAGLGVAVDNAVESLKEAADVVVAACEEGGVAEAIETYLGQDVDP